MNDTDIVPDSSVAPTEKAPMPDDPEDQRSKDHIVLVIGQTPFLNALGAHLAEMYGHTRSWIKQRILQQTDVGYMDGFLIGLAPHLCHSLETPVYPEQDCMPDGVEKKDYPFLNYDDKQQEDTRKSKSQKGSSIAAGSVAGSTAGSPRAPPRSPGGSPVRAPRGESAAERGSQPASGRPPAIPLLRMPPGQKRGSLPPPAPSAGKARGAPVDEAKGSAPGSKTQDTPASRQSRPPSQRAGTHSGPARHSPAAEDLQPSARARTAGRRSSVDDDPDYDPASGPRHVQSGQPGSPQSKKKQNIRRLDSEQGFFKGFGATKRADPCLGGQSVLS